MKDQECIESHIYECISNEYDLSCKRHTLLAHSGRRELLCRFRFLLVAVLFPKHILDCLKLFFFLCLSFLLLVIALLV